MALGCHSIGIYIAVNPTELYGKYSQIAQGPSSFKAALLILDDENSHPAISRDPKLGVVCLPKCYLKMYTLIKKSCFFLMN